ncbi:MAG: hypothetical protein DHS20C17_31700 [Cyclobacteriaceae bacterium]|nr:MAG: hypothetical protein DHS20C17_31700 [Cyclobacteriaceae bacterium]
MSQERVKPSKSYLAGEVIEAPLYGIRLTLPEHWNGFLTRSTEIFTLNSDTTGDTSIMIFPSEESLQDIETRWRGKVEFSPGIVLIPESTPQITGGKLTSAFTLSGNENQQGYAFASCGDFGFCYTAFLMVGASRAEYYGDVLNKLAANINFFQPTITEYYGDYEWPQELKGKYMVTYERGAGSNKQNHLWLCEDGTFKSQIKRKGGLKGSTGDYKGKLTGTYTIEGTGATGRIQLDFEKLTPLQLPLEIKDEVIYMNGLRYSISGHDQCK